MRITCPHCQAVYQLPAVDSETTLVCHRCNTEFSLADTSKPEQAAYFISIEAHAPNRVKSSVSQAKTALSVDAALEFETPEAVVEGEVPETSGRPDSKSEPESKS